MLKTSSRARIGNFAYAVVTNSPSRAIECPTCKARPGRLCIYTRGIRSGELYDKGKDVHRTRAQAYRNEVTANSAERVPVLLSAS